MMPSFMLNVAECPVTGERGLHIEGLKLSGDMSLDLGEGVLIAHDIVEHVNGLSKIGTIEDELEALGAIWVVRGQYADLSRDGRGSIYSPEENIALDITRLADITRRPLRYKATHTHDEDNAFRDIIQLALRKSELKKIHHPEFHKAALSLMRTGARKLRKRFRAAHSPELAANAAFWSIASAVKRGARYFDYGDQFKLYASSWYSDWRIESMRYDD